MRIALAIATTGRPAILAQTLLRLRRQTRRPDRLLVVGAKREDWPDASDHPDVEFMLGKMGSSSQRNAALDRLGADCDVVVFLDDDFVAARDFLVGLESLMRDHPDVVAGSGHLLADGWAGAGIAFAQADALIAAHENDANVESRAARVEDQPGMYGCNMFFRLAAAEGRRFDENLPAFAWLEDLDFSMPFKARGRLVTTDLCVGVHLGVKSGRTPGLMLGYSQIANPLYLAGKGTLTRRRAATMALRNTVANALRSLKPEPWLDRRGRLHGNLLAMRDLLFGRCRPDRILDLSKRVRPSGATPRPSEA